MDAVKIIKKQGEPGGLPVLTAFVSADAPGEVPASAISDSGKVLTVGEDGVPAWAESSGGGGGVTTLTVNITATEAVDIYQGNSVTKSLEISDAPNIIAITTPDGSSLLCYLSQITATTLTWRNIADADLNISCQYSISDKELYITQRNLS